MQKDHQIPVLEVETDPFADAATIPLSETVSPLADAYDETIGDRDRSLWQWFSRAAPEFRFSCVDADSTQRGHDAKVLATMFITVIDDVIEQHGDRATFEELSTVPFDHQRADPTRDGVDGGCIRFQRELWAQLQALYEDGPRADEFLNLLRFDLRMALRAVDYSALLAQYPSLASERELWTYDVHNMMVFVFTDIDLANASSFDATELGALRRVVTRSQRMARIGNWIATWERELTEGDCSSGVVVRALESGLVSAEALQTIRTQPTATAVEPVVETIRASRIEDEFVDCWRDEYAEAAQFIDEIDSVDVQAYLEGFETIFRAQLANRPSI